MSGSTRVRGAKKLRNYVAHFFDSLRIHVKGGPGGQGFPSRDGVGGKGGDVIGIGKADYNLIKLSRQFPSKRFMGSAGMDAKLFCTIGEPGEPKTVPIPLGVTVLSEQGYKMGDVNKEGERVVLAKGGPGGSELNGYAGQKGETHSVTLDLKLIADVGFVGFPNAGKSTLLKAMSKAKPRIASYPFTTVKPNVGVIEFRDYRRISLADLPGLIEGAHINYGMGHKFLKHVERTRLLLFIIDTHGFRLGPKYPLRTAIETIILLNRELELYQEELTRKPAILALNKMDLPDSFSIIQSIKDTLNSEDAYLAAINSMPRECRPKHLVKFDNIVAVSAAKDRDSVLVLTDIIRKCIDVNDELETSAHANSDVSVINTN